jgi:hypothetical protein
MGEKIRGEKMEKKNGDEKFSIKIELRNLKTP